MKLGTQKNIETSYKNIKFLPLGTMYINNIIKESRIITKKYLDAVLWRSKQHFLTDISRKSLTHLGDMKITIFRQN